jgi:serine/threonine protein kinase
LLQLGNLRWVAFSNNPFLEGLRALDDNDLTILDDPLLEDDKWPVLGQGAGGVTRKVTWNESNVAVKTFSGELTSDGSPQDERAISVTAASLKDSSLIQLFGQTNNGSLVMEFLEGYEALAGPPSLETCSRDVYASDRNKLSEQFCWEIATNLLRALQKLHQKGICHGDFYAHNILISSSNVKLSDFGAAFFYDTKSEYGEHIQTIELRSYSVLVEELHKLVSSSSSSSSDTLSRRWEDLTNACVRKGATFEELAKQLEGGI